MARISCLLDARSCRERADILDGRVEEPVGLAGVKGGVVARADILEGRVEESWISGNGAQRIRLDWRFGWSASG